MAKFPQDPLGVPKLANLTVEMLVFIGHDSFTVALFFTFLFPSYDSRSNEGWSSDIWAQTLEILRVANLILVGSPPFSSKITKIFPDGLNQDRGIWYL